MPWALGYGDFSLHYFFFSDIDAIGVAQRVQAACCPLIASFPGFLVPVISFCFCISMVFIFN
ncbi:hypothetical protein BDQ94DRAFT_140748 [Aspergillus welwitschiae]|uniref:Uncharacterized protein n=1 Tax=Aspergillus welwitschiae TaxID=1341132 RepID=A0A3F3Q6A2_9EURO|nr:hypothetical protein BDQ94DRAFT_140748 [Aspergillus welwitschiae]RDH34693.1 hypothetical protein BDQ94DRAFT_140748 [Aspergillus welwitschiae]